MGKEGRKLPQREKADIYNGLNYATKRLRDDRSGAWGQGWPEVGRTHTLGTCSFWTIRCCSHVKGDRGIRGGISWPRAVATEMRGVPPTDSHRDGDEPGNVHALGRGVPRPPSVMTPPT